MARPLLLTALAAVALATAAFPVAAKTDPGGTVPADDQSMPDKIREKLSADGYRDITVLPTSYAVSATDKDGKRVLLLIGPGSSTTPEEGPSTAQSPPGKDELIEQ